MNEPVILVVPLVIDTIIPKRHIADSHIKEAIRNLHLFKAGYCNAAVLIELLCQSSGYTVDLYAIQMASLHAFGQKTKKIPNAAGRLQNVACAESHVFQSFIDHLNHSGRRVVGVQNRGFRCGVLVLRKQRFKFRIMAVSFYKAVRQTAPAYIPGENFLFFRRCQTIFCLNPFQAANGRNVGGVFFTTGSMPQFTICDTEISAAALLVSPDAE